MHYGARVFVRSRMHGRQSSKPVDVYLFKKVVDALSSSFFPPLSRTFVVMSETVIAELASPIIFISYVHSQHIEASLFYVYL